VLAVQPCAWGCAQEKLAAVGMRAGICHGKDARAIMLEVEVFIIELGAIDRLPTGAISSSEVTTLAHELWDDPVEGAALEMQLLSELANSLFTSAKRPKVLHSVGHDVSPQLHDNPARRLSTYIHIEEHPGILHC
jgi:hypothetical protein